MEIPLTLEPDDLNPGFSIIRDVTLGGSIPLLSIFSPLKLGYWYLHQGILVWMKWIINGLESGIPSQAGKPPSPTSPNQERKSERPYVLWLSNPDKPLCRHLLPPSPYHEEKIFLYFSTIKKKKYIYIYTHMEALDSNLYIVDIL